MNATRFAARNALDHAPAPSCEWRTQLRISRCRGLGYCVIEVHEFDVMEPGAPPSVGFRVYHEEHGFPVGEALAAFGTLEEALCHAEARGMAHPTRQPAA